MKAAGGGSARANSFHFHLAVKSARGLAPWLKRLHRQPPAPGPVAQPTSDLVDDDPSDLLLREIGAVLRKSEELWDVMDFDGLRALWDTGEAEPYYLPEEIEAPLIGWPAIEAYWRNNTEILDRIRVRYSEVYAKLVSPDLAVVMCSLRYDLKLVGPRKAIGGENRMTALFRRTRGRWRYCHYVEAPISPIVYVRRLYEKDVSPDFESFAEEKFT